MVKNIFVTISFSQRSIRSPSHSISLEDEDYSDHTAMTKEIQDNRR